MVAPKSAIEADQVPKKGLLIASPHNCHWLPRQTELAAVDSKVKLGSQRCWWMLTSGSASTLDWTHL